MLCVPSSSLARLAGASAVTLGVVVIFGFGFNVLAKALVTEGAASTFVVVAHFVGDVAFSFRVKALVVFTMHETASVSLGAVAFFLEFEALPRGLGRNLDWFTISVLEAALVTISAGSVVPEVAAYF